MQQNPTDSNLTYQVIEAALSAERLAAYRTAATDTNADILARYLWNIELGDALWSSIHIAEVTLRNQLDVAVRATYGDDWLDDPEVLTVKDRRDDVAKAKAALVYVHKQVTHPRVVAELNLGFWTALLKQSYENGPKPLWPLLLGPVFPHLNPLGALPGRGKGRSSVESQFDLIRKLRNRISHHEPIWHGQKVGQGAPRRPLPTDHSFLLEAIAWLSIEMGRLAEHIDNFPAVFSGDYATHLATAGELLGEVPPDEALSVPEIS